MIVVDASVLANALGDGHEAGDAARAALSGMQLAAPDLVDWETLSVLRKRWLTGDLNDEEIRTVTKDLDPDGRCDTHSCQSAQEGSPAGDQLDNTFFSFFQGSDGILFVVCHEYAEPLCK